MVKFNKPVFNNPINKATLSNFGGMKFNMNLNKFNNPIHNNSMMNKFNIGVKSNIPYNRNTTNAQFKASNPSHKMMFRDSDRDGYVNTIDCFPFDRSRQGGTDNIITVKGTFGIQGFEILKLYGIKQDRYEAQDIISKYGDRLFGQLWNLKLQKKYPQLIGKLQVIKVVSDRDYIAYSGNDLKTELQWEIVLKGKKEDLEKAVNGHELSDDWDENFFLD